MRVREPLRTPAAAQLRRTSRCTATAERGRGCSCPWRPSLTNSGCSSRSPTPRARGWTLSQASSAWCTARGTGTSARGRPCRARTAGSAARWSGGGADHERGGLAARRSEARSHGAPGRSAYSYARARLNLSSRTGRRERLLSWPTTSLHPRDGRRGGGGPARRRCCRSARGVRRRTGRWSAGRRDRAGQGTARRCSCSTRQSAREHGGVA